MNSIEYFIENGFKSTTHRKEEENEMDRKIEETKNIKDQLFKESREKKRRVKKKSSNEDRIGEVTVEIEDPKNKSMTKLNTSFYNGSKIGFFKKNTPLEVVNEVVNPPTVAAKQSSGATKQEEEKE